MFAGSGERSAADSEQCIIKTVNSTLVVLSGIHLSGPFGVSAQHGLSFAISRLCGRGAYSDAYAMRTDQHHKFSATIIHASSYR
jgi:hypothetical protein